MIKHHPRAWQGAAVVSAVVVAVFGPMALRCELYLDDYSFFLMLSKATLPELWNHFLHYVPGRNLHIPFFAALLKLTGGSLWQLHLVSLAFDAANASLAYLLALELTGLSCLALPAALFFALVSNHGETHFWITLIPQCQIPVFLTLLSFLIAARPRPSLAPRLAAALAVYTLGLFTYDQVFFLWPLLIALAWARSEPSPRAWRAVLLAAAYGLGLNLLHLLLRYLSPHASGGRPLIRLGSLLRRCAESVYAALKGTFSLPSRPYVEPWAWAALALAAALAGAWLLLRLERRWLMDEESALRGAMRTPAPLRLALFGGLWFLLAYLPNYFWYLSPRHNYLPSFGWSLLWVSALAWLWTRRSGLGPALRVGAGLLLANAAAAGLSEGSQWVYAGRLHREYLAEASRFFPVFDNLFLLGAPRYVRRGPAFNLYHDTTLSAALAAGAVASVMGDNQITPGRRGAFYFNDLSIWDSSSWRWLPYEDMNLVSYDKEKGFRCVRTLRLKAPDGRLFEAETSRKAGCAAALSLDMDAALESASQRAGEPPARPVPGLPGLGLARASLAAAPGLLRLTLDWAVARPPGFDLALVPEVLAPDGRTLYEPIYPSRTFAKEVPLLWPLHNDELPASRWRPGSSVRETFLLRLSRDLPAGPCRLRLKLYRLSPRERGELASELEVPAVVGKE